MRSRIEIAAELRRGVSVLTTVRGGGHFAGRQTGPTTVHLVGTAAGPLGGDEVTIAVRVGPGASLSLRSAAATVVLPGLEVPGSRLNFEAFVDDGAWLEVAPEPTVVCRGAVHEVVTSVALAGTGQVRLLEQVVLGRSGEAGGAWTGRLAVTRDGRPVLRHTLRSGLIGVRAIASLVDTSVTGRAAVAGSCVAMPLAAGGMLVTGTGSAATALLAELEGAAALGARGAVVPEVV
jgi:urease accessory protein